MTKENLYAEGLRYVKTFCDANNLEMPTIKLRKGGGACGEYYFGKKLILINLNGCAKEVDNPGYGWSHRHYFVDREPCGVVCHEFGHYVHDILTNNKFILPKENPITNYEPNICERFAETMKLFILNPNLLKEYAPKRYDALTKELGLKQIIFTNWKDTFEYGISKKYITACENRIARVRENNI